jgi:hypothetical protein
VRKVKENRPELGGMDLMLTPPISSWVHVFSGGRGAAGRITGSADGAMVEEGWPMATARASDGEGGLSSSEGLFGFVIVMADLATPLEAIALARARWWGDRAVRIVSSTISVLKHS